MRIGGDSAEFCWRAPLISLVARAQSHLKLVPPSIEEALRVVGEADERWIVNIAPDCAERRRFQLVQFNEDSIDGCLRLRVRRAVDVLPMGVEVGIDSELKPLNQSIIAAAGEGFLQIGAERPGLNAAKD